MSETFIIYCPECGAETFHDTDYEYDSFQFECEECGAIIEYEYDSKVLYDDEGDAYEEIPFPRIETIEKGTK